MANAFVKTIETTQRGRFENVERLFLARYQFGQVAAAAIEGMHEKAHAGCVACFGSGWVLVQKLPEAVGVAGLQEFQATFKIAARAFHGRSHGYSLIT